MTDDVSGFSTLAAVYVGGNRKQHVRDGKGSMDHGRLRRLSFLVSLTPMLRFLLLATLAVSSLAFGLNKASTSTSAKAAVEIFQKKYPVKPRPKRSILTTAGMPGRDIDGTQYRVAKMDDPVGPRFSERDPKDLQATYQALAKVYGDEAALQMVKDLPIALAFNRNWFAPSLKEFAKTFGEEEAKAMVSRNPGLLALPPTGAGGADSATDQTMQFSYLVAATRPAGPFLLYGTLGLLMEPFFEMVSGIPLKSQIFSTIGLM